MKTENLKLKIDPNNLHHGYLIVGEREATKQSLFDFFHDELKIQTSGNPDFLYFDFNTLTIDEARDITRMQERKGFIAYSATHQGGGEEGSIAQKFFVISTNIITVEAQNALLKVFEEPTPGTHFFILVSQNTFLPTFLSRLHVIQTKNIPDDCLRELREKESILEKSLAGRLALVDKLAGDISDEKKVKQDAIELVNQIETELYNSAKVGPSQNYRKNFQALEECQFARNALFSRGAMIKMILENLMLQI